MVMKFSFLQIFWRFICQKNVCKFFFARNQYFGWFGELNFGPKSTSRYNLGENWHFYCGIGTIFVGFRSHSYLSMKYTKKWTYSMKMTDSKISGGPLGHFQKSENCEFLTSLKKYCNVLVHIWVDLVTFVCSLGQKLQILKFSKFQIVAVTSWQPFNHRIIEKKPTFRRQNGKVTKIPGVKSVLTT